ncbi:MAG TPA: PaaI family thioesterase [Candidatus Scybalocola faecavium]|nr:PaaI family thioesterase [Candidatus Scybalocola faecavium]
MTTEELKKRIESNGFAKHTGVELLEAENGTATGRIVLNPIHGNPIGSIHGGCIFTLVDTISGTAVVSTGKNCTTLSANIDYLNAAIKSKVLTAHATPARIGNHIAVIDVKVTDDRDVLIAKASVTFYILRDK